MVRLQGPGSGEVGALGQPSGLNGQSSVCLDG